MGRLIDADKFKAINGMKDDCADCDKELRGKSKACEFDRVYTKMDFCGWLDDAPTVDAVPVRHGEWVWVQYDANPEIGNFHCSKCRFIPAAFNMAKQHLNYCPNCGARMDGE